MRFRVLRLLENEPELSQRELSRRLGVSLGGINYCLHALIETGLVKLSNFRSSEDKRRYAYVLTRAGFAEKAALAGRFLARKLREYEALQQEIAQLRDEIGPGTE
ncbi:MAG: hypothetical protein RIQ46_752 [Pseudomonadota bacterium]